MFYAPFLLFHVLDHLNIQNAPFNKPLILNKYKYLKFYINFIKVFIKVKVRITSNFMYN